MRKEVYLWVVFDVKTVMQRHVNSLFRRIKV